LLFPADSRCRGHLGTLSLNSSRSKIPGISMLSIVPEISKYFRFRWPYCYFRLSVVVEIIHEHWFRTRQRRKPQFAVEKNTSFVLLIKHVWPFYPQTQYVCAQKNRSEMRGLIKFCMYAHANGKVNLSG